MHQVTIEAAALLGAGVLLAALLVARRVSTARRAAAAPPRTEPRSVVHLLVGEDELREAIERASRFERRAAEALEHRAAQYESLLPSSARAELRSVTEPDAGAIRQSQSA